MSVTFNNQPIPGILTRWHAPTPQPYVERTHFAGLNGESEIRCGSGRRPITLEMLLCSQNWTTQLLAEQFLQQLDEKAGNVNGPLVIVYPSTGAKGQYLNCTFDGFDHDPDLRTRFDYIGGLFLGQTKTWFARGIFRFTQLSLTAKPTPLAGSTSLANQPTAGTGSTSGSNAPSAPNAPSDNSEDNEAEGDA